MNATLVLEATKLLQNSMHSHRIPFKGFNCVIYLVFFIRAYSDSYYAGRHLKRTSETI